MIAYNEWKHKSSKATKLLRRIQKEVHSLAPGPQVILYGSRVRGESEKTSDWDLLILVNQHLDQKLITEIRDHLYDLELETDTVLSSIIRTREEWYSDRYSVLPLKQVIEREGVLL